jgi:hypothetical protein
MFLAGSAHAQYLLPAGFEEPNEGELVRGDTDSDIESVGLFRKDFCFIF